MENCLWHTPPLLSCFRARVAACRSVARQTEAQQRGHASVIAGREDKPERKKMPRMQKAKRVTSQARGMNFLVLKVSNSPRCRGAETAATEGKCRCRGASDGFKESTRNEIQTFSTTVGIADNTLLRENLACHIMRSQLPPPQRLRLIRRSRSRSLPQSCSSPCFRLGCRSQSALLRGFEGVQWLPSWLCCLT